MQSKMSTRNRSPFGATGAYAVLVMLASTAVLSPALAYSGFSAPALTPFRRPACGRTRIPLCMVPSPRGSEPRSDPEDEGTHTYVEGLNFGSREDEVLAKGGDPFFLPDEEDDDNSTADDTTADENGEEFNDKEAAMPSMTFMSSVASMPGTLDVVGRGSTSSGSNKDKDSSNRGDRESSIPFDGAGVLHTRPEADGFDEQKAALLDLGGDPFFLQEDEGADVNDINEDDSWDGWVVEDAHLD